MIDVQKYRFSFEYASLPNFVNLAPEDISSVCVVSPQTPCSRNSVNSNLHLKFEDHLIYLKGPRGLQMIPFQFPDLVSKKPKIRGFGWSFNGMREQGSLKGEGTHRGNLFVHNFG